MLRLFLKARGELSRVEGESALAQDLTQLTLLTTEIVDQSWERVPPPSKAYYQAFADGINRYIETHPETKQPWYWELSARDIAIYVRFTIVRNGWFVASNEMRAGGDSNLNGDDGSNAWAVSGSRSASGRAMLHGNPTSPTRATCGSATRRI
jgi:acyl-homoserine lactone acylase PvdQ